MRARLKFSLSLIALSGMGLGCAHPGPLLDICVSNPDESGFDCQSKKGEPYFLPYRNSGEVVGMPATDFEAYVNYCSQK